MPRFFVRAALAVGAWLLTAPHALAVIAHTPVVGGGARPGSPYGLVVAWFVFVTTLIVGVLRLKRKDHVNELLPVLAQHDAAWDTTRLIERVQEVFARVQEAWKTQDLPRARDCMTPEFQAEHQSRLDARRAKGLANFVDQLQLQSVEIYHVDDRLDDAADRFRAFLRFHAVDYDYEVATGQIKKGMPMELRTIEQTWRFIRADDTWLLEAIEDSDGDLISAPRSGSEALGAPAELDLESLL